MILVGLLLVIIQFTYHYNAVFVLSADNVPHEHLKYYKKDLQECHINEATCRHQKKCWGYEKDCKVKDYFSYPVCDDIHHGWAKTLEEQQLLFWNQADFGYVKKRLDTMEFICKPVNEIDSSLKCSQNWDYCAVTNLYMDFRKKDFSINERFHENFFNERELSGSCSINKDLIHKSVKYKGELQSWYADLNTFSTSEKNHIIDETCDEVVTKPTIFMKLDAGVNMYHHFCDFLNLYASQHVNGSFSTDVFIVMWDTSSLPYGDIFTEVWNAFTRHPLKRLSDFAGKKVCFKDAMFAMLPRMVYGLFYNTPLVQHCRRSGLFKAFSEHVLHRLNITQNEYEEDAIRITLLKRSTKYRKIINEEELIGAMTRVKGIKVTPVDYKYREMNFLEQLKISHNTDIFIGMHGAGLTHSLFLPDWGVLFEIYNTEDADCYKDLAHLRGLKYLTWEHKELLFQQDKGHHPTLGEHPKFTNYAFNVDEFMRLLTIGIKHVLTKRPHIDV